MAKIGAGLGFRRPIADSIRERRSEIDCLEIVVEQFNGDENGYKELERLREIAPVIPHGLNMSIGSSMPLHLGYIESVRRVCDIVEAPYYSDHLCITRVPGIEIGHLTPMFLTRAALRATIERVCRLQDALGRPVALENISSPFQLTLELDEPEFFSELCVRTGCYALLDVHNLYVNAINLGIDTSDYLARFPMQAVIQLHLAGGGFEAGYAIDGHDRNISSDVWTLLDKVCALADPLAVIVERDINFDDFDGIMNDVRKARQRVFGRPPLGDPDASAS